MTAFYNEIDPVAAHVLRAMIADGHIAPGDVCERSIKELTANDLRGYTQCHFFAGGGFWSVAARLAGWRDDKPLWTASCPCQPFSQAGKGAGIDDPRHLWPDVDRLIREAVADGQHVPILVGEQVGGSAGYDWFNGVRTDLESQGYETFVADTPACAVDAPHIRQRLYWVAARGHMADADFEQQRRRRHAYTGANLDDARSGTINQVAGPDDSDSLEDAEQQRKRRRIVCGCGDCTSCQRASSQLGRADGDRSREIDVGNSFQSRLEGQRGDGDREAGWSQQDRPIAEADGIITLGDTNGTRELQRREWSEGVQSERGRRDMHTDGRDISFWSDHQWIKCHDGKARRAKSSVRNVADGIFGRSGEDDLEGSGIISEATDYSLIVPAFKGRVNAWKITGNAIVSMQAAQVLGALLDTLTSLHHESQTP